MKKIIYLLISIMLIVAANVHAMDYESGPYLGGQVGWGRADYGDGYRNYINTTESSTINGISGRGYAGYSFTRFFSIEGGYTYYHTNNYTGTNGSLSLTAYAIDLVGKITLPLGEIAKPLSYLSVYGKGGGAYLYTTADVTMNSPSTTAAPSVAKSKGTIVPAYGVGIIFNFTDNIAVDLSWMGILGTKRVGSISDVVTNNPTPLCNLFTIGFSYKITGL